MCTHLLPFIVAVNIAGQGAVTVTDPPHTSMDQNTSNVQEEPERAQLVSDNYCQLQINSHFRRLGPMS